MLKNLCIYPNFRLLGEIKTTRFKQGDKETTRISFLVSSYKPDANGLYLHIKCNAFDQIAEEILRLNIKDGDIITVFCEQGYYKRDTGVLDYSYKVLNFNLVRRKKEGTEKKERETSGDEFMDYLMETFS